jgi:hypothetical protein
MKIRDGFVSNSSSSSFLVPVSIRFGGQEDLRKLLFPLENGKMEKYVIDHVMTKIRYFTPMDWKDSFTDEENKEICRWMEANPGMTFIEVEIPNNKDQIVSMFLNENLISFPEGTRRISAF